MKITIEGDRGEGKSTLALMLQSFMRHVLGYSVDRVEEGIPDAHQREFNREEVFMARNKMIRPRSLPSLGMRPRKVQIVVKNSPIIEDPTPTPE